MKIAFFFFLIVLHSTSFAQANPYQIGSKWGREAFTFENASQLPPVVAEQAKAVARFSGGTAFYLGKFDGRHIMATNYHILPTALNCHRFNWSSFILLDEFFGCKSFIRSFSEIELALFELRVKPADENVFEGLGISMAGKENRAGLFYGFGYGYQNNPRRASLLLSHDEHCRLFSNKIKFLADPDTINPTDYQVWSGAIGCDLSHGDSGAPIFNASGGLVGINWTGGAPKPPIVLDDDYLASLLGSDLPGAWENLSYMVPLRKIQEVLQEFVEENPHSEDRDVIQEIIRSSKENLSNN